jgi:hypothetical protein
MFPFLTPHCVFCLFQFHCFRSIFMLSLFQFCSLLPFSLFYFSVSRYRAFIFLSFFVLQLLFWFFFMFDYLSLCRTTVSGCRWVNLMEESRAIYCFVCLSRSLCRGASDVVKLSTRLCFWTQRHTFTALHASPNGTVTLPDDTQSDRQLQSRLLEPILDPMGLILDPMEPFWIRWV